MRLTPLAVALQPRLKSTLVSIREMLHPQPTELVDLREIIRLVMADISAALMLPALCSRLAVIVPLVTLVVMPWQGAAEAVRRLNAGEVELVASVLPPLDPAIFGQSSLLEEHYLIAMRTEHPAAGRFDLDSWLAYPHVVVSGDGAVATPLDTQLAQVGRSRRVDVAVSNFSMVPLLLQHSDLVAMLPSRTVPRDPARRLATFPPPLPVGGFRLDLAWHHRREADLAVRHVAAEMAAALRQSGDV